jgi:YHS domain-containing protein
MKRTLLALLALALLLVVVGCAPKPAPAAPAAGPTMKSPPPATPPAATTKTGAESAAKGSDAANLPIGNAKNDKGEYVCPVSGKAIADVKTAEKTEYKGKVYYFCCADCPPKFKADPEKYITGAAKPTDDKAMKMTDDKGKGKEEGKGKGDDKGKEAAAKGDKR